MQARSLHNWWTRLAACGGWVTVILIGALSFAQAEVTLGTGAELHKTLESHLTVSWTQKPVREALADLSRHLRIAVLLDRRIDPSLRLDNVGGGRVQETLDSIAARSGAAVRVVGNVIYVGPESAARVVRTLSALRTDELSDLPSSRAARLRRPSTLRWNDLDRPDEILGQIAKRYELTVEGLDRVPLDMWAGAVLPEPSAAEQLTLVLVQFDLTFEWQSDGRGIRIVPLPEVVALERAYAVGRARAEVLAQHGREAIAGLEAEADGESVRVRGTLEQHERLAELLRAGSSSAAVRGTSPRRKHRTTPQRLFSLRVRGASIAAVLHVLETEHGFAVFVDKAPLAAAEASLSTPVDLDVSRVTIDDLLTKLLSNTGFTYRVEGQRIHIATSAGQ